MKRYFRLVALSIGIIFMLSGLTLASTSINQFQRKLLQYPPSLLVSNNQLAMWMLQQDSGDKNTCYSPTGVIFVLAMLQNGLNDQAFQSMAKVLQWPMHSDQVNTLAQRWAQTWARHDKNGRLSLANALWLDKQATLLPSFVQTMHDYYDGLLFQVDFSKPKEAVSHINQWTLDQTGGMIPNFLQVGDVINARLIVENAIYFDQPWRYAFDPKQSQPMVFHGLKKSKTTTMMTKTRSLDYMETPTMQMLRLPYNSGRWAMTILLPKKTVHIEDLIKQLSHQQYLKWSKRLFRQKVRMALPKWSFTTRSDLTQLLKRHGVISSQLSFDLLKNDMRPLQLSRLLQKARIEVSEKGTRAAAATAGMMKAMAFIKPKPVPSFVADHPFIFVIDDVKNHAILFIGKMMWPE